MVLPFASVDPANIKTVKLADDPQNPPPQGKLSPKARIGRNGSPPDLAAKITPLAVGKTLDAERPSPKNALPQPVSPAPGSPRRDSPGKLPRGMTPLVIEGRTAKTPSDEKKPHGEPLGRRISSADVKGGSPKGKHSPSKIAAITKAIEGVTNDPFNLRPRKINYATDKDENFLNMLKTCNDKPFELPHLILELVSGFEKEETSRHLVENFDECLISLLKTQSKAEEKQLQPLEYIQKTCTYKDSPGFIDFQFAYALFKSEQPGRSLIRRIERFKTNLTGGLAWRKSTNGAALELLTHFSEMEKISNSPALLIEYLSKGLSKGCLETIARVLGGPMLLGRWFMVNQYHKIGANIEDLKNGLLATWVLTDKPVCDLTKVPQHEIVRQICADGNVRTALKIVTTKVDAGNVAQKSAKATQYRYFLNLFTILNAKINVKRDHAVQAFRLVHEHHHEMIPAIGRITDKPLIADLAALLCKDMRTKLKLLQKLREEDIVSDEANNAILCDIIQNWETFKRLIVACKRKAKENEPLKAKLDIFDQLTLQPSPESIEAWLAAIENLDIPQTIISKGKIREAFIKAFSERFLNQLEILHATLSVSAVAPIRTEMFHQNAFEPKLEDVNFEMLSNSTHLHECVLTPKSIDCFEARHRKIITIFYTAANGEKEKVGSFSVYFKLFKQGKDEPFKGELLMEEMVIDDTPLMNSQLGQTIRALIVEKIKMKREG